MSFAPSFVFINGKVYSIIEIKIILNCDRLVAIWMGIGVFNVFH